MIVVIVSVVLGFALLVLRPANFFARVLLAKKQGKQTNEISDDEAYKWTWVLAVPVYLLIWWSLEISGLLAVIADEFR